MEVCAISEIKGHRAIASTPRAFVQHLLESEFDRALETFSFPVELETNCLAPTSREDGELR